MSQKKIKAERRAERRDETRALPLLRKLREALGRDLTDADLDEVSRPDANGKIHLRGGLANEVFQAMAAGKIPIKLPLDVRGW